jgi:hypothetical protein
VPSARRPELDRELKETQQFAVWQWFLLSLIVLTILDYFYLQRNG